MFVEVEYGYGNVTHVADTVTIDVRVRVPVGRGRFSVET